MLKLKDNLHELDRTENTPNWLAECAGCIERVSRLLSVTVFPAVVFIIGLFCSAVLAGQGGINAVTLDQLRMGAVFDNLPLVHNQDAIRMADRR